MTSTSILLSDVVAAARAGRVPVAAETAGYLALAVADALVRAPMQIGERSVMISPEGTVSVTGGPQTSPEGAERALRQLLGRLLDAAPASTPALGATARRAAGAGVGSLVTELEAALIPVNRAAARRALARLVRETEKASYRRGPSRPATAPPALSPAAARPLDRPPGVPGTARPRPLPPVTAAPPDPPAPALQGVVAAVPSLAPPAVIPRVPTLTGALPPVPSLTPPPVLLRPADVRGEAMPTTGDGDIEVLFTPAAPLSRARPAPSSRPAETIEVVFSPDPPSALASARAPLAQTGGEGPEGAEDPEDFGGEEASCTEAGGPVFTLAPRTHDMPAEPATCAVEARDSFEPACARPPENAAPDALQDAEFAPADAPSVEAPHLPTPTMDVVENELTSIAPAAVVSLDASSLARSIPDHERPPEEEPSIPIALLRPSRSSSPAPPTPLAVRSLEPPTAIAAPAAPAPAFESATGAAALPCLGSLTLTPAPPLFALIEADQHEAQAPPGASPPASAQQRAPLALLTTARAATVDELLAAFVPSDGLDERAVSRSLKMMAGLEPTLAPPDVMTSPPPPAAAVTGSPSASPPPVTSARRPALADRAFRPPRSPRAALAMLWVLLVLGLAAVIAVWVRYPSFFTGHSP